MNLIFIKIFYPLVIFLLVNSCSSFGKAVVGKSTPETEMHRWLPPTDQEIAGRLEQQTIIDEMEAEIQVRYLYQERLLEEETALLGSLDKTRSQIQKLDPFYQKQINKLRKFVKEIQDQLAKVKVSRKELLQSMIRYKDSLIPKKLTADNYVRAIRLFQLGEYKISILAFKSMLKQNPPRFLIDNIHFGLGNAYYKMEKWDSAVKHFKIVVNKYPLGNKWPASHFMLGLIYGKREQKSKALYILTKALKMHLPNETRKLIESLLQSIQAEAEDVSSQ